MLEITDYPELLDVVIFDEDEMDAPSDWDAGNVCFDPYV